MIAGTALERLALLQGAYYAATGIWPLLSMRSFERVTGRKREHWLVKTVGLLVAVTGATLGSAALRRRVGPDAVLLGAGTAAALGAVDVVYAARRRIAPIYLADAAMEGLLLGGWTWAWARRSAVGPPMVRVRVAEAEFLARPDLWHEQGLRAFLREHGLDPDRPFRRHRCRQTGALVFSQRALPGVA